VAPAGFCNRGEVRYGSIGGLEYEVPQSRLYCLCINVARCSTALQCICRVIRRSSMTMKAHTYYIIFGRPPIGGKLSPLAAPLACNHVNGMLSAWRHYNRTPVKPCSAEHFLKCSLTVVFRLNSHINHRITFAFWMYWMMKSQLNSAAAAQ